MEPEEIQAAVMNKLRQVADDILLILNFTCDTQVIRDILQDFAVKLWRSGKRLDRTGIRPLYRNRNTRGKRERLKVE